MIPIPTSSVDLVSNGRSPEAVLLGEIDVATAPDIRREIDAGVDWSAIENIRFDLRDVQFMDSSGLAALIWMRQRHEDVSMSLLVRADSVISSLLDITSMQSLFDIESDPEIA